MDHNRLHKVKEPEKHINMEPEHCMQIIKQAMKAKGIDTVCKDISIPHFINPVIVKYNIRSAIAVDIDRVSSIHIKKQHKKTRHQQDLQSVIFPVFPALFSG